MDLTLREVKNNIGEIELGDVLCLGNDKYYLVSADLNTKFYYLKSFDGLLTICYESTSLESLRENLINRFITTNFIHYPAKEYRLELVKK